MKICVVGAGPAAAYFIKESLARSKSAVFDVFEKSSMLLGYLAKGVAPDQRAIRETIPILEKVFKSPQVNLFTGVEVGKDVDLKNKEHAYSAIVIASGADVRHIDIAGQKYAVPADKIVRHIADSKPVIAKGRIAVIGNGNVALDISRMLLHSEEMKKHSSSLEGIEVREVEVIGRHSPEEAKFTNPVLSELLEYPSSVEISERAKRWFAERGTNVPRPLIRRGQMLMKKDPEHTEHSTLQKKMKFTFWESPIWITKKTSRTSAELVDHSKRTENSKENKSNNYGGTENKKNMKKGENDYNGSKTSKSTLKITEPSTRYELTTIDDRGQLRTRECDGIVSAIGYKPKDFSGILKGVTVPVYEIGWAKTKGQGALTDAYTTAQAAADALFAAKECDAQGIE
ncbi:adrenodoxin-NADP+ reductase [Nematocida minor]|uniref:adrenodoxin-NADP+ reductase n=1 Tax=Nematocida minor TaxID=1912983 RepID=UPI00221F6D7E|nr:adrenodoxin-NADP+ reductase [Nematocida minor]KAI5190218.1 adrenodoxin-NADP+ reductase [Nematocida minor]